MLRLCILILCLAHAGAWKLLDHRYDEPGPYEMDLYLQHAPSFGMTQNDVIYHIAHAIDSWNWIPNNAVQIYLRDIYDQNTQCKTPTTGSLFRKDLGEPRGVICFDPLGPPGVTTWNVSPYATQTNSMSIVAGGNVFINPMYVNDIYNLYNVVLHEMGHINLLGHPDSWIYLFDQNREKPIMAHRLQKINGAIAPGSGYHTLAIDDVAVAMMRPATWS